jgi:hypothetical protein
MLHRSTLAGNVWDARYGKIMVCGFSWPPFSLSRDATMQAESWSSAWTYRGPGAFQSPWRCCKRGGKENDLIASEECAKCGIVFSGNQICKTLLSSAHKSDSAAIKTHGRGSDVMQPSASTPGHSPCTGALPVHLRAQERLRKIAGENKICRWCIVGILEF